MPLIKSARENAHALVSDILRDFALPVVGVLLATHVASMCLISCFLVCVLRCARAARAHASDRVPTESRSAPETRAL
jgi:hypothetical protein